VAYRAEIEIVAKGVTKVTQLQKGLNQLAKQIDHLNGPGSLKDFNGQLAQAKKLLDRAQQGTVEEKRAVDKYVTALKNANTAQVRTNKLIAEEIRQRDGATASLKRYNAAAASARQPGGSMAGQYLRPGQARGTTQFAGPIGPGPASPTALSSRLPASSRFFGGTQYSGPIGPGPVSSILGGQSSAVEGRIKRILEIKKGELQLEKALIGLQQKSKGLDAASIADNNRILDIKAKEVSRNNEIIRQEKVKQSILRKRQRLEAAGRGSGSQGAGGRKFQDIATGAGFPLLFGGGPLQAVAGGIGGALGGLGGSIAASALTAQVEAFAKGAAETGQALNSTGGALDLMREKSLFSSKAVEEQAAALEEQGQVSELATLLTGELVDKIGNSGVEALQSLGTETDETTRLWAELTLQLQTLIAGPLQGFLSLINNFLGGVVDRARLGNLQKDLEGTAIGKKLTSEIEAKRPKANFFEEFILGSGQGELSAKQVSGLLKKFGPLRPVTAKLPITKEDQQRFAVKPPKARAAGVDRAAREEERLQQRLAALEVERQKILEISGFKDKIAAAEALNDTQTVIRLQGQQKLGEIEAKRLSDLTKVTDQRLKDAINITAATKKLAAHREMERQLAEDQRKRQELFNTTIEDLEHQLKMTKATSQAERDRLKIAKEMKKLKDKKFTDDQVAQAGSIMEQLAVAQEPLNAFIRKATEDLNNLQQVAVDVSQGIGNAIGGSLVNGLQGLVTGATSVKQVFADMLKSVADVLAKTASQMIAQYIAIGIARIFAGMGGGGGGGASDPFSTGLSSVSQIGGGGMVSPFAEGGFVNKPTNALIGEGGEPEYVIPESKMRESMSRYSRGSRGNSVIPASGDGGTESGGGGTAVAAPIDVRYTVERINSVDYVTADQFQSGMQSAAAQGAKRGEQNTLKRLQMSGSTRKRLGL
jgi:hypothetical protein